MFITVINREQNVKNTSFENRKIKCLQNGDDLITQSKAVSQHIVEDRFIKHIRVEYSNSKTLNTENFLSAKAKIQATIIPISIQNSQSFEKQDFQEQQDIQLNQNRQCLFIGRLKNEYIELKDNLKEIKASIIFNDIYLNDNYISPFHLEVNYAQLVSNQQNRSWLDQILRKTKMQETISNVAIDCIQNHLNYNKKKLKIVDVSNDYFPPTLIQIKRGQENSQLEEGQRFFVGFQPILIVVRLYLKLEHFFMKYSFRKNRSQIEMVFEALQSLQWKVAFAGVDVMLAELFMLVQDRNISLKDYKAKFDEHNFLLNKVESLLQKTCILLETQNDNNLIDHFMLVADQKYIFIVGRMQYLDITFLSSQVSRNHAQIEFNQVKNQWTIMDGVDDEQNEWRPSTFGLWLQMVKKKYYYVDSNQSIKIGIKYIIKLDAQKGKQSQGVNEETQEQYDNKKTKDLHNFLIQLLEM